MEHNGVYKIIIAMNSYVTKGILPSIYKINVNVILKYIFNYIDLLKVTAFNVQVLIKNCFDVSVEFFVYAVIPISMALGNILLVVSLRLYYIIEFVR